MPFSGQKLMLAFCRRNSQQKGIVVEHGEDNTVFDLFGTV